VNECCAAKSRGWHHAAAVAGALSLFVALVAGSALRPHYNTAVLPEPVVWTHVTHDHPANGPQVVSSLQTASSLQSTPATRKPFRNVWMTRELPLDWISMSTQRDWSELPASFLAEGYQLTGAQRASPATTSTNRHTVILLGVNRC
jgi:hypothetical protein